MAADGDLAQRIRDRRAALGLTQAHLAAAAGVSRAGVSALEQGRHMPAADAAVRLAAALQTTVERLFGPGDAAPGHEPVPVIGAVPTEGALVRRARVGGRDVAHPVDPAGALTGGAARADAVVRGGRVHPLDAARPGAAVIVGCDPLLALAEGLLEGRGPAGLLGVSGTSGQALEALRDGRCHGVLVHGPAGTLKADPGTERRHLARWRSGLATPTRLGRPSLDALLGGGVPLVERDRSAACQQAVDRAARRLGAPRPAPAQRRTAAGHLDAARTALTLDAGAVAIEPVALALGLDFLELEVHDVELWVPHAHTDVPGVGALLDLLTTARFRDRADALPAYDLSSTGDPR